MKKMISILVGYGYWGKIMAEYIRQSEDFELIGICDPHLESTFDWKDILESQKIDCAFVCAPIDQHYELVFTLLENGMHVFCEKPLCRSAEETLCLYEKAGQKGKILFTDYIYTVSPSIRYMKAHIDLLGKIRYIDMDIRQFGRFYQNDSVYEVIGVHMVSVLDYLLDAKEKEIEVTFTDVMARSRQAQAVAGCVLFKVRNIKGRITCSLISNEKVRRIELLCDHGTMIFDMFAKDTVKIIMHKEDEKVKGQKRQEVLCRQQFDEKNNLYHALKEFQETILTGNRGNERISIRVAEVLDKITQLENPDQKI